MDGQRMLVSILALVCGVEYDSEGRWLVEYVGLHETMRV